jgi:hypothetical protein
MSSKFAGPLGCPSDCFFAAEYISYWETHDYYDFVIIEVVTQFARSVEYRI